MRRRHNHNKLMLFIAFALTLLSSISSFADQTNYIYDDNRRVIRQESGHNEPVTFTITATAGANGSIVPSGTITVNKGASQSFTVAPANSCYLIKDVQVDGVSVGAVATYSFSNIISDHDINAIFDLVGPAPPTGLTASAVSQTQINLSWMDRSNNETGFRIERKTGAGGTYAAIATVGANVTTFSDTTVAGDTVYYYRVWAFNATQDSCNYSEVATASLPNAPTNLTASTVSASQINLTWTDNSSSESGYKIERKTGAGGTYGQIATVGPNITSYSNTGLSSDTVYYYQVRAYNSGGNSAYSNAANNITAPAAPSNLTVAVVSATQINLSWTDNSSSESGFKIERKTGAGGTYAQVGTAATNATTFSDTGLSPTTTYFYHVKAYNGGADSAFSNEQSGTTPMLPPLANFSASPVTGGVPLAVIFTDLSSQGPTSWLWNFGDGTTSTLQNPSHLYRTAGTYSVTLTASNPGGSNSMVKTNYITAQACPSMPVRINGATPSYFSTLQDAYNAAPDGATIQSQAVQLTGNATLNRNITVTLDGGYDCQYTNSLDTTLLQGLLTISSGAVTIKNFWLVQ